MPYRFRRGDDTVQDGVRRIAGEVIAAAVDAAGVDADGDAAAAVHEARKGCKQLRGLIRLVRPAFADYAGENEAFRDAAAALSDLRDADVLIGTYDALAGRFDEGIDRRALGRIRRGLTGRRRQRADGLDVHDRLQAFRDRLRAAGRRAERWHVAGEGFDALAGGLTRTRRRADRAMAAVREAPSDDAFHEWRKRVKYHWYHARLLRPVWPGPMDAHVAAAHALGDLLGDHHDLAVFRGVLASAPDEFGGADVVQVMTGLATRRQAELAARAFVAGGRLQAEKPSALARRWGPCWDVWRAERKTLEQVLRD